jgi:hypothetical protein
MKLAGRFIDEGFRVSLSVPWFLQILIIPARTRWDTDLGNLGNARRAGWEIWQVRQRRISNLHIPKDLSRTDPISMPIPPVR